jgi:RNA polymerase sigma-70 factor (ECF subfamily)
MRDISQETIIEAAGGSIEAFEAIYRHYSGYVYTVAYRVAGNTEDAEEVTQDVFLKVHRKIKGFRFKSAFKTWIYRITMNMAINALKKRSRKGRQTRSFDVVVEDTYAAPEKPDELERKEKERSIEAMLESLNPEERACVVLKNVEGLKYREISKVLGININTVRTRLKRAREKLVSLYHKEGLSDEV